MKVILTSSQARFAVLEYAKQLFEGNEIGLEWHGDIDDVSFDVDDDGIVDGVTVLLYTEED